MQKENKEYKNYEFGKVPVDWEIKKIGEIFDNLRTGSTPSRSIKDYYQGNIPWISSGELKYKLINETNEQISEEAVKKTNLKKYPPGTFFIAITGLEAEGTRGSCAISNVEATTNQSCMAFEPRNSFSNWYLFYWYIMYGEAIAFKYAQGTKQQSLNHKIVEQIEIPVPSLDEQQRIANILLTVDEQIEQIDQLIEKSKELKRGLMRKLLLRGIGNIEYKETEIGKIPASWEVVNQGEVSRFYNGRAYKRNEFKTIGTPIIRIQNLTNGSSSNYVYSDLKLPEEKYVEKGDLIYAWSATFGPFIWKGPKSIYHYHIWKIVCDDNKVDKMFFYYRLYYISEEMSNQKNGSVFAHLTKGYMESHKIALPPLSEQKKIAKILTSLDEKISVLEEIKLKKQKLKKGLMQQLLTGNIRV